MRNLRAVLVAVLLATGIAQAKRFWSPPNCVLPISDSAWTSSSNARCIVGAGQVIHVVFSRDIKIDGQTFLKVYYSKSSDLGFTWTAPVPLSPSDPDHEFDSKSPSISMWSRESLLVVWCDSNADYPTQGKTVPRCLVWAG